MTEQAKSSLPRELLLLDMIGTVLIGVGLADGLGKTALVPASLQFSYYAATMVGIGIVLVLPLGIWMIRNIFKAHE